MARILLSRALGAWFIEVPLQAPGIIAVMVFALLLRALPDAQSDVIYNRLDNVDLNLYTIIYIISCIPPFVIGFLYPKKEYRGMVSVILIVHFGIMLLVELCYIALKGSVLDN